MASISISQSLSAIAYVANETIVVTDGATLTINTTPSIRPGTITTSRGKVRIVNSSTTTPIVLTFDRPSNRIQTISVGELEIQGGWITVGVGNNTPSQVVFNSFNVGGQTIDHPTFVEVETGLNTGVYLKYFVVADSIGGVNGNIYFLAQAVFGAGQHLGRSLFFNPLTGDVRCGDGVNGNRIPAGSKVRVPNIHITCRQVDTTLSAAITNLSTSLALTDASLFASIGDIQIGNERITYTSKTGNTLNGCTRSALGTTALASNAIGSPIRSILSAVNFAQTDTNANGKVSIDKCSFGYFRPNLTACGDHSISDVGCYGSFNMSGVFGDGRVDNVSVQFDTRQEAIGGTSHFANVNAIGRTDLINILVGSQAIAVVHYGFYVVASSVKFIKGVESYVHRITGVPASIGSVLRSMFCYGMSAASILDCVSVGSGSLLGQASDVFVSGFKYSDSLNGVNQSSYSSCGMYLTAAIRLTANGFSIIGSAPRTTFFLVNQTSVSCVFSNKGKPSIDLQSNTGNIIQDFAGSSVLAHFSFSNLRGNSPISAASGSGAVFRSLKWTQTANTSSDGVGYGSGANVDNCGGNRRAYNSNEGCVNYSPFSTLSTGSIGLLVCGAFGAESTRPIYTISGSAYLNNSGSIFLPEIGDSIVITALDPLMAITGFRNVAIDYFGGTPQSGLNYEFSLRRWGWGQGDSWSAWAALSIANLNAALTLLANYQANTQGLDFRLRITATTTDPLRSVVEIVIPTNSDPAYNPFVHKIDCTLYGLAGAAYSISEGVNVRAAGVLSAASTVVPLPSDFDGTIYSVTTKMRKPGFIPAQQVLVYSALPIDSRFSLEDVDAYTSTSVTGISFNKATKTIEISASVTTSNIYDRISQWISELINFDTDNFAVASGGALTLSNQWNISILATGAIDPGLTLGSISTNGILNIVSGARHSIPITDANRSYYPAITLTGFPVAPNSNSLLPAPVLGVKNNRTGVLGKYSVSNGAISVNLSSMGLAGDIFTLVGDANGYHRTSAVTLPISTQGGYDFSALFREKLDSDGQPICGRGVPSEMAKITYNATTQAIEIDSGKITFNSFCDKLESIFNTETSIADWDSNIVRGLLFERNPYASTVSIPSPIKINTKSGASSSAVLADFVVVEAGNLAGDPFGHVGLEVRMGRTKILSDPNPQLVALTPNLALIPACIN